LIRTGVNAGVGLTVKVAVFDPLSVAVTVTVVEEVTELVVIWNVFEVLL